MPNVIKFNHPHRHLMISSTTHYFTAPLTYHFANLGKTFDTLSNFRYVPTDIWHSGREKLGPWIIATWDVKRPVVFEFIQSAGTKEGTYAGFHTDYTPRELCAFMSLFESEYPMSFLNKLPTSTAYAFKHCDSAAAEEAIASFTSLRAALEKKIPHLPATNANLKKQYNVIDAYLSKSHLEAADLGKPLLLIIGEHHQGRSDLLHEMAALTSAQHYDVRHYYFETSDTLMPDGWNLPAWNHLIRKVKTAAGVHSLDNSMLLTSHISKTMQLEPLHYRLSPLEHQVAIKGERPPIHEWRKEDMSSTRIHSAQMIDDFLSKHPKDKAAMITTGANHVHDYLSSSKLADFHVKAINAVTKAEALYFHYETSDPFLFAHPLDAQKATDTLFHDPRVLQLDYAFELEAGSIISKLATTAKLFETLAPHEEL
jgi:hypothetical protein